MSAVDLWVDFNELDERNRLSSLIEFISPGVRKLAVGAIIMVGDYEGNRSEAEVIAMDDEVVEVALRGHSCGSEDDAACPVDDRELLGA
jgi:hypothetical protein